MTSNEEFLFQKIWKMSEEESAGTHYNEKDLTRRLATYNSYQNNQNGQLILSDFWSENDIPMTSIPIDQDLKVLDLAKSFIEKNGNIQSFLEQIYEEREVEKKSLHAEKLKESAQIVSQIKENSNLKEEESREITKEAYSMRKEELKKENFELLEKLSNPLKEYFEENVVEKLVDGLLEVVQSGPDDPIDYLAEYLFKRSLEVKNPLPSVK